MKNLIQMVFVLIVSIHVQAQEKVIQTESVTIENLIPFIVEKYASTSNKHNIILLFESKKKIFSGEAAILFKQAVKYLSEQLTEDDTLSIITYNALSGIVLNQSSAKNIKKILHVLNDFSANTTFNDKDGITLAYNYANEKYKEGSENTILLIRNPNGSSIDAVQEASITNILENKPAKKSNNSMVLLTAIAVLPELIAIIKN